MALAQAADQASSLRALFRETGGRHHRSPGKLLKHLNITPTDERCYLLQALLAGLAVVDLATARKNGQRRAIAHSLAEPRWA
jgi:hypothetical protein